MIIVCTGGRDNNDTISIDRALCFLKPKGVLVGDCPTGVDLYVREWCRSAGTPFTVFKADWDKHGEAAGPIRNKEMVRFGLKMEAILIAFKGNKGTTNCKNCAKEIGMLVLECK